MTQSLTALIGSRICHDLISPIGAIGNGLELLGLTMATDTPELALIQDSVDNANARIRFFRIAYGAAGPDQQIGRDEVLSVLSDMARGGRITYFWRAEGPQSRQNVQIIFLLLQCLEAAMPRGGTIDITATDQGWQITGNGERIIFDDTLWDILTTGIAPDDLRAAHLQFALAPQLAPDATIDVTHDDTQISIAF